MWEAPPADMLDQLRAVYLQAEGEIEGRSE